MGRLTFFCVISSEGGLQTAVLATPGACQPLHKTAWKPVHRGTFQGAKHWVEILSAAAALGYEINPGVSLYGCFSIGVAAALVGSSCAVAVWVVFLNKNLQINVPVLWPCAGANTCGALHSAHAHPLHTRAVHVIRLPELRLRSGALWRASRAPAAEGRGEREGADQDRAARGARSPSLVRSGSVRFPARNAPQRLGTWPGGARRATVSAATVRAGPGLAGERAGGAGSSEAAGGWSAPRGHGGAP